MKHIFTLIILTFFLTNIKGQDTTYSQLFDIEYRNIDFSKSNSDLIFERSFNFSGFNCKHYTEIDTLNNFDFLSTYNQLYNSQRNQSTLLLYSTKDLKNSTKDLLTIPIGLIYCNYSKIDSNSFLNGRLYFNNDILYEDTTIGFSTFKLDTALFIAPLQYSVAGANLEFLFSTNYFYSNLANSIDSIKIDFNDGLGFRSVNITNNLFSVNYSSEGIKTIVFHIYIGNNLIVKKSQIKYSTIKSGAYDHNNLIPYDDEAYYADIPFQGYAPFNTTNSYGRVSIRYYYHHEDKKLRKPIIISDGFDPGNYRTFEMSKNGDDEWVEGGIWELLNYEDNGDATNALIKNECFFVFC